MTRPDDLDRLVSPDRPEDAKADWYARRRPDAVVHRVRDGDAAGVFVEGTSPYGLVGVLRADDPRLVAALLARVAPGRRYVMTTTALADALARATRVEAPERNRVSWIRPGTLREPPTVDAALRTSGDVVEAVIGGRVASRCGVMWRSDRWAELQVATEPESRRRGLGRAVVAAAAARLLADGVAPLYVAESDNAASLSLADSLGFESCDELEFAGYVGA